MRAFITLVLTGALFAAGTQAAEPPAQPPGKASFDKHCAECHAPGPGHPGTQRLAWSRGERFALLEQRKDLSADYVRAIVRRGLFEMPPFRPTEISDRELDELSNYLAKIKTKRIQGAKVDHADYVRAGPRRSTSQPDD
jgi:(+)-pinoresinol hydroxylase